MTLVLDQDIMPTSNGVRESISELSNLKESILEHILDLENDKQKISSTLNKYEEALEKCSSNYVPKIIDIPCSGVANFNFLSVGHDEL